MITKFKPMVLLFVCGITITSTSVAFSTETPLVTKSKNERYVYLNLGQNTNDSYNADLYDVDNQAGGVSLGFGFQVRSSIFVDFRFTSLGDYENSNKTYTESYSALSGNLLGRMDLGDSGFNLYGSVGYGLLHWEYEISSLISVKDSGDTITAGVGIQYKIPGLENYVVSLGYDQYYFRTSSIYGSGGSHSNTISVVGIGLQYRMSH